jgi:hypothetical protein
MDTIKAENAINIGCRAEDFFKACNRRDITRPKRRKY